MRVRSRHWASAVVVAAVLMASFGGVARAQTAGPPDPDFPPPLYTINGLAPTKGDNVVLRWTRSCSSRSGPTLAVPARP
jgi:hypothetical protein